MRSHSRIKSNDKIEDKSPLDFMLAKLRQSNLTKIDATTLGYQPYNAVQSAALGLHRPGVGFKIPYCTADGRPLPMFRYRYRDTAVATGLTKGAELRKYDQPAGTDPEVYFPRVNGVNWPTLLQNPELPLLITEGELKAACATKVGHPTIGLGGVYSFGRKAYHQTLLPALQAVKWKERPVYICYDSDAVSNPDVLKAENRLARVLTDQGAIVYIVRLPGGGKIKVGLDDYIVANGEPALQTLLESMELWAENEALHQINAEVVYVEDPSMVVVLSNGGMKVYSVRTFITEVYADRHILVINPKNGMQTKKSAADMWIKWPARSKVRGLVYEPGQPRIYESQLNTWRGWGAEPVAGNIKPWLELTDYMFKDAPAEKHWFMQWLAYPMQFPGTKLKTAAVLWSVEEGTGKSILAYTLGKIYGNNASEVTKAHLSESFNSWAVNKQFIIGEEITGGSGRGIADSLKNMITGTDIQVNVKYKPHYSLRNCLNYLFTSNHSDAFFMKDKDRRYFVHEVPPPLPAAFWQVYDKWYKSKEGRDALFYHLLQYDLTGFDPQAAAPHTRSRLEMIESGLSEQAAWVTELKQYPDNLLRIGAQILPYTLWTTKDLMALYASSDNDRRNKSERTLAMALKETGFKRVNKGETIDTGAGVRKRAWAVRNPKDVDLGLAAASERYQQERNIKTTPKPKYGGKV